MAISADFESKVALVTGGASGIGAATSTMLAMRGAFVVVADLDRERARQVAQGIVTLGGKAAAVRLDATDAADVQRVLESIGNLHGGLDLAVNSAGISLPRAPTGDYPLDDWKRIIDLNLNGVFYCLRHEIPQMLRRGGGAIVNLSSIAGVNGIAGVCAYTASKHAVIGLTKTCALDYATRGIRVNAVAPGFVDTPLLAGRDDEALERIAAQHPLGRMATASEIAEAICFLLSERASFVTGSVQLVDGGYSAR